MKPEQRLTGEAIPVPDLIFDIGLGAGDDAEFYLLKGFRVVGVDASPEVCASVAARFPDEIAEGRLVILNRPVAEARATVAHLAGAYGVPHYAKIDLKGRDELCLEGFIDAAVRPRFISAATSPKRFEAHIALLEQLGYSRFSMVGQGNVPKQKEPSPAREGRYLGHEFKHHSSGLFGREVPTAWWNARDFRKYGKFLAFQFKLTGAIRTLEVIRPLRKGLRKLRGKLPVADQWYDIHAHR